MNDSATRAGQGAPEHGRLDRARRRLAAVEGFFIHLGVFVVVMAGLVALNWAMHDQWWVQWVFLGWGLGVLFHALAVFGRMPAAVQHWEKRKLREYMRS